MSTDQCRLSKVKGPTSSRLSRSLMTTIPTDQDYSELESNIMDLISVMDILLKGISKDLYKIDRNLQNCISWSDLQAVEKALSSRITVLRSFGKLAEIGGMATSSSEIASSMTFTDGSQSTSSSELQTDTLCASQLKEDLSSSPLKRCGSPATSIIESGGSALTSESSKRSSDELQLSESGAKKIRVFASETDLGLCSCQVHTDEE